MEIIYQNRRGIPPLAFCCHLVLVVGCSDLFPHLGAHRCPKPKKQNKARLFAVDVQEPDAAEDTGEQDNTAHGIMDDQDLSPESDDEGDPVDGPQYLSDEGDVVNIYDNDGDSNGEPVACLGSMYTSAN